MEILLSEEQESLAEAVREWLTENTDLAKARGDRAGDEVLYTPGQLRAAAELGLQGLLRAGEEGTYTDLAVVVAELGRAASPLPLGHAALAARLLDEAGIGADVADAVAEGGFLCVPAAAEPDERPILGEVVVDTLVLAGHASAVVGGLGADHFLVVAEIDGAGRALALVAAGEPSMSRRARTTLDLTRDIAAIDLHAVAVPAGRWARLDAPAAAAVEAALVMLTAVDAAGAAERLVEMTVGYVKERSQFGRLIGSFQAVRHTCATMALDTEAARLCAFDLARALDDGRESTVVTAAAVAGALVGEAASRTASSALQMHGGMGFTWEHDLHLFLRRVKVDELGAGTPRQHRDRLLALAG